MDIFGFTSERPPAAVHVATTLEQVRPLLAAAEVAALQGRWVAVMVAYEAATAFNPAMRRSLPDKAGSCPQAGSYRQAGSHADENQTFPLAWAAEFDAMSRDPRAAGPHGRAVDWPVFRATVDEEAFCDRVRRVQAHINDGDTYQVNLTFPLTAKSPADTRTWFERLRRAQQAPYAAYINLGRYVVASLSPELFFEREGGLIRTRPMKGTIRRGRWLAEDDALARALASSRKAQAENVMIVDLLRNDVGRVAATGTVHVPSLFSIERYPTLWQMTSTVEATLRADATLPAIFDALFPCGSITGAPKIRTMELIAELEGVPRGLYTGAIGLIEPGGRATFSVAIRTIVTDRETGVATMGVGAGITADSVAEDEYAECLLKGAFASPAAEGHAEPFFLMETMRLEDGVVIRRDRHLQRMQASARYFGYHWNDIAIGRTVDAAAAAHTSGAWRLRLTVDANGTAAFTCTPHLDASTGAWRVAFANAPIDHHDPFMFNKTTSRHAYDAARRGRPDVDDVLLWNARRELTESTIANVVVEIDGVRSTPAVECGLLAGTFRGELVDTGAIRERVITRGDVVRAERLWLINSLRGWVDAVLVR